MLDLAAKYVNYGKYSVQWVSQLAEVLGREGCVLVTMDLIVGSAPREAGCRMIVTASDALGSIGGGSLEFEATAYARELLAQNGSPLQEHRPYALGPALNQCCGGAVTLLFERFGAGAPPPWLQALVDGAAARQAMVLASAIDRAEPFKVLMTQAAADGTAPEAVTARGRELLRGPGEAGIETLETADEKWWLESIGVRLKPLILFGAGHVGQAVARLLADLPFEVTWVDGRPGVFPDRLGPNIDAVNSGDALAEISKAPRGSIFVVMTHSHQLDEDICFRVLSRGDFAWLGLIGSVTKRRRFTQRLARRGIGGQELARLVCPIGLEGIKGKQPATIALSLVAQLMHRTEPDNEAAEVASER
jgi:xanthine dehydrogenase accessory factor